MGGGKRASAWAALALSLVGCLLAQAHARGLAHALPPEPLADALDALARESGLQIIYSSDLATGVISPGAQAGLSVDDTLRELLRGTGLTFEHINDRAVTLVRKPPAHVPQPGRATPHPPAPAHPPSAKRPPREASFIDLGPAALSAAGAPRLGELQQVLVTGSHIPGFGPVGTSVVELTRADIERSGYSTVQDVIRSLPQNFNGGPKGGAHGNGLEELFNASHAEGIDLRGLGAGSTLVLLDGRRIAPGAGGGRFVDVSAIPVSAIERIEILPEGASAIYGADAVGGVVNVILRDDYRGAETQLRFGSTTGNGPDEALIAQTLGAHWARGSALMTFEYWRRGDLPAADRVQSRDSNLQSLGGGNFDTMVGNPGTILAGRQTWAIPYGQDGRSLTSADLVPGTVNLHDNNSGSDVLPNHERWSVVGTLRQQIGDRSSLFADAMFSSRHTIFLNPSVGQLVEVPPSNPFYVNPAGGSGPVTVLYGFGRDLGPLKDDATARTSSVALGADVPLGGSWTLTGYVDRASVEERVTSSPFIDQSALAAALADPNPATAFDPFGDGSFTSPATLARIRASDFSRRRVDQWETNLNAHGTVADWGGRQIALAIGSDWRYEALDAYAIDAASISASSRLDSHAAAVFGELSIPLVAESRPLRWAYRARVSLAARYESYAGLGSALTPRVGLDWSPDRHLTLEGSWGRSFAAPDLADLDESANLLEITVLPDPKSPTGASPVLLWTGGNAALHDQTATTWTAGARLQALADHLTLGVTYFDIDFVGRIERINYSASFLTDPIYAALVTRNPSLDARQDACSRGRFLGAEADCTGAPVAALVDMRLNNVAATETSGIDFAGKYRNSLPVGDFAAQLDATYLLAFRRKQFAGSPSEDLLDTTGYPLDLRLRGTTAFQRGPIAIAGAVNFFDSYRDTFSHPERRVGSWTTLDLQVAYTLGRHGTGALAGTTVTLAAQNLLNTDPPFVNNPAGVGYDPENASLLGRLVSITVRKPW